MTEIELTESEGRVLSAFCKVDGVAFFRELVVAAGINDSLVAVCLKSLAERGLVHKTIIQWVDGVKEKPTHTLASLGEGPLEPWQRRVCEHIVKANGSKPIYSVTETGADLITELSLGRLKRLGMIKEGPEGVLRLTQFGTEQLAIHESAANRV